MPYAVFSFAGMVLWTFFAQGLSLSSNSLVGSSHLITKVYFPRVMVPVASVTAGLLDLAISFVVLLVIVLVFCGSASPPVCRGPDPDPARPGRRQWAPASGCQPST